MKRKAAVYAWIPAKLIEIRKRQAGVNQCWAETLISPRRIAEIETNAGWPRRAALPLNLTLPQGSELIFSPIEFIPIAVSDTGD